MSNGKPLLGAVKLPTRLGTFKTWTLVRFVASSKFELRFPESSGRSKKLTEVNSSLKDSSGMGVVTPQLLRKTDSIFVAFTSGIGN